MTNQSNSTQDTGAIPHAAWLPMSQVPKHGRRIYALERGGKASIIYANPELERSLYLAWWPVPEHGWVPMAWVREAFEARMTENPPGGQQ